MTAAELWKRGQEGCPRRFPIVQFPNPPLLAAFAGWGLASRTAGPAHDVGRALSVVGLAVWAGEEAIAGTNWFGRALGVGALASLVGRGAGMLSGVIRHAS